MVLFLGLTVTLCHFYQYVSIQMKTIIINNIGNIYYKSYI